MQKYIPNTLTCLNLITGAVGCIAVIEGQTDMAVFYVIVAAAFDFADGFVARWLRVMSAMGKELDSLADAISFGLLPALFMVETLSQATGIEYLHLVGLMIVVFSALRLAKFNIDPAQGKRFSGLPTPANAIAITSLALLPAGMLNLPALLAITAVSSWLLVSGIPLIALKFESAAWSANRWKYIFILVVLVLFVLLGLKAFPLVVPVYILISILENFWEKGWRLGDF